MTFCLNNIDKSPLDDDYLNFLFSKAEFVEKNSTTHMIGEVFSVGYFDYHDYVDCIRFNHYKNRSDNMLFADNTNSENFLRFTIDLNIKFNFLIMVCLSDNYSLDSNQYLNTLGPEA